MAGTNKNRSQLDALSLQNFPNNTNQDISPADLREWLEDATASFVTQKDKSTLENVLIEAEGVSLVAAPTVNLASATGNFLHVTGNSVINSFGIVNAGARFVIVFDGVCNLVYNSTQLILPGMSNITTAAGDCIMLVSEGNGDWRVIGYFSASGSGSGTITGVTAGTGLSGGGASGTVTLSLSNISPDPYGNYTNANITVDSQGRITAASNGTGGGITALTGDVTASGTGSVAATIANGAVDIAMLSATGTPDATTFLRGDNEWATPAGGNPGGNNTELQFNNSGSFGGVSNATWDGTNLTFNTPRIGQSTGNGHLHLHTINTNPPTGLTDYVTLWADKSPKQVGYRFEQDGFTSAFEFGATADRVYTLPDAAGNIVIDSASQALSNKSFTNPTSFSNGTSAGEIRLLEGSGSGNNYVALKSPATLANNSSLTLTLPTSDGTSGYSLITNGAGQLSWAINGGSFASKRVINTTQNSVGGTGNTYTTINTMLIPANTFATGDVIKINVIFHRSNSGFNGGYRLYLNTSVNPGGNTIINATGWTLGQTGYHWSSIFILASSTETIINLNLGVQLNPRISNPNINWGVNQYLVLQAFSGSPSSTDVITSNLISATLL